VARAELSERLGADEAVRRVQSWPLRGH